MNETITAKLNNIRYQNGTGFIIGMFSMPELKCKFANQNGEFGGLGNILNPQVGMEYQLVGEWSVHPDFGNQFKFQRYTAIKPKDTSGIYKYLVRVAKWVGPATAEALVDTYGEDTLDVLRNDPELVAAEIKGINEQRAAEIQEILVNNEQGETILVELIDILDIPGLRRSLPYELIEEYGSDAAETLKANPYVITQFYGTGFLIADRLALQRLSIPVDSMLRLKAAVKYAMDQDLNSNGNTWISRAGLTMDVSNLTSINDIKRIYYAIDELIILDEAIIERIDEGYNEWLALSEVDRDETEITDKIKEMMCL